MTKLAKKIFSMFSKNMCNSATQKKENSNIQIIFKIYLQISQKKKFLKVFINSHKYFQYFLQKVKYKVTDE